VQPTPYPHGGIPALVAEGLRAHDVAPYELLHPRRILERADPRPRSERWALDAYVGCAFGCRACSAAEWPAARGRIGVKLEAAALLERECGRYDLHARPIVLGCAGDPYPAEEGRRKLTRALLSVLARQRGLRLALVTRSTLLLRDLDVLRTLAQRSRFAAHVVLGSAAPELARKLDPGAPSAEARLSSLRYLAEAGVPAGLAVPVLPEVNDSRADLRALFEAAARAHGRWIAVAPVPLTPPVRRRVADWVRSRMPEKLAAYRALAVSREAVDPAWRAELRETVAALRREIALPAAPRLAGSAAVQLALPGLAAPSRAA
jgi:DNA repair photolyase